MENFSLEMKDITTASNIKIINKWINNISSSKTVLIINGKIGVGKTTLCNLIEEKYSKKYKFYTYSNDIILNKIKILDLLKHNHIYSSFMKNQVQKGLLFDDIKKSNTIKYLLNKSKENKYPVIVISNTIVFTDSIVINIKQKSNAQLLNIYTENCKINKSILKNIINKSNGDFNYINKTLLFIKLSPNISLNDMKNLSKDINYNSYFLLMKFLNTHTLDYEEYDHIFAIYLYNNLHNVFNLFKCSRYQKLEHIAYIYKFICFINTNNYIAFIMACKEICKLNKLQKITCIKINDSRNLLNNNIKAINLKTILNKINIPIEYIHNHIAENIDNKYNKLQKFLL